MEANGTVTQGDRDPLSGAILGCCEPGREHAWDLFVQPNFEFLLRAYVAVSIF